MAFKKKEEKVEVTKKDIVVELLKERVVKLFDQEPRGSLKPELVDALAEELINL